MAVSVHWGASPALKARAANTSPVLPPRRASTQHRPVKLIWTVNGVAATVYRRPFASLATSCGAPTVDVVGAAVVVVPSGSVDAGGAVVGSASSPPPTHRATST